MKVSNDLCLRITNRTNFFAYQETCGKSTENDTGYAGGVGGVGRVLDMARFTLVIPVFLLLFTTSLSLLSYCC